MLLERRAYCQSLIAAAMERWVRRDVGVPTGPAISLAHSGAEAVFNVRDYGALGNGVEDDLRPIQAAVRQAERRFDESRVLVRNRISPAPVVYFPPGVYRVSGSILVGRQLVLRGEGMMTSILASVADAPVLVLRMGALRVYVAPTLRELGITGSYEGRPHPSTRQTGVLLLHDPASTDATAVIDQCAIVGCGGDGFRPTPGATPSALPLPHPDQPAGRHSAGGRLQHQLPDHRQRRAGESPRPRVRAGAGGPLVQRPRGPESVRMQPRSRRGRHRRTRAPRAGDRHAEVPRASHRRELLRASPQPRVRRRRAARSSPSAETCSTAPRVCPASTRPRGSRPPRLRHLSGGRAQPGVHPRPQHVRDTGASGRDGARRDWGTERWGDTYEQLHLTGSGHRLLENPRSTTTFCGGGTLSRRTNAYSEDFGSDLNAAGGYRTPLHGWACEAVAGSPSKAPASERRAGACPACRARSPACGEARLDAGRRLGARRGARERLATSPGRGTGRRELRRRHVRQGQRSCGPGIGRAVASSAADQDPARSRSTRRWSWNPRVSWCRGRQRRPGGDHQDAIESTENRQNSAVTVIVNAWRKFSTIVAHSTSMCVALSQSGMNTNPNTGRDDVRTRQPRDGLEEPGQRRAGAQTRARPRHHARAEDRVLVVGQHDAVAYASQPSCPGSRSRRRAPPSRCRRRGTAAPR